VAELGYEQLEANLRTAPVYVFMAAFNISAATLADRLGERGWVVAGCLAASAGGMLLLALSIVLRWPLDARYALCFLVVFYSATSPLQLAWLQRAYRNRTEAAVGPALVLTIGSLGAFVGPLVYGNTASGGAGADASYVVGHFAMFGVFLSGALLAAAMRVAFHERASDRRLVVRPAVARAARSCCFCCGGSGSGDVDDGDGDDNGGSGGSRPFGGADEGTSLLVAKKAQS
jgi:MFS family permease